MTASLKKQLKTTSPKATFKFFYHILAHKMIDVVLKAHRFDDGGIALLSLGSEDSSGTGHLHRAQPSASSPSGSEPTEAMRTTRDE